MIKFIIHAGVIFSITCAAFISPSYGSLDSFNQRYLNFKKKSLQHEQNVKELLSRPKIRLSQFDLPEPKKVEPIASALSDVPEPNFLPIPEMPEEYVTSNDNNLTSPPMDFDDLVVDPGGGVDIGRDTNESESSEELESAYDEFHSTPVPARREGYYFGPFFGFSFPSNGAVINSSSQKVGFDSDTGILLGLQVGRDYGQVRWEAEYNYLNYNGEGDSVSFDNSAHNFISHLLFEFELGERADLRTGLGMGVGFLNFEASENYDGVGFIYDFVLGGGYRVSDLWSLNLDYRYYFTAAGDSYDRIKSHMLVLSANYDL